MTAPLKHSDPIRVDVALGDRAYDIVIGRDVLQSLGTRIAALRPDIGSRRPRLRWRRPALHRQRSSSMRARARKPMPASKRSRKR
jgi:hypothetical protein